MTEQEIFELLNSKLIKNENLIEITFYEMRIERNLSDGDAANVLHIISELLKNKGYKIYRENQNYFYNGKTQKVPSNVLMLAIKQKGNN